MINRSGLFDGFDEVMNMADADNESKAKRLLQLRQALLDAGGSAQQVDEQLVQVMTIADTDEMPPGHRIGVKPVRALDLVLSGAAIFSSKTDDAGKAVTDGDGNPVTTAPEFLVKALKVLQPAPAPASDAPPTDAAAQSSAGDSQPTDGAPASTPPASPGAPGRRRAR